MMRRTLALIAALSVTGIGAAQDAENTADSDAVEVPRHYSVEVIIFKYLEDVSVGSEIFVPERVVPDPEPVDEFAVEPEPEPEPVEEELAPVYPFSVRSLPGDEMTLDEAYGRLERLDAYEPLMHFGWVQPTLAQEHTPALPLARFARVPDGLDGTLTLYLNRYLHLVVDVSLAAPPEEASSASPYEDYDEFAVPEYGDGRATTSGYGEIYLPLRYRIVEDRILKNGETRYYDHPKFGVIAKVLRIEDDEDETSQDDDAQSSVAR